MNNFQKNLKILAEKYSQKYIADQTGYSQSSINNYITKNSEPSIQFLIALKNAFGICIDDFLFTEYHSQQDVNYDRFIGNYIVYYYNNSSYKGEVHTNLSNTLHYGVISVFYANGTNSDVCVCATFVKEKVNAVKLLKSLNALKTTEDYINLHKEYDNFYEGEISVTTQGIFIGLNNKLIGDQTYLIFNNPPSTTNYIGGVGTVNTISRGREHNPCVQFIIMSKKLIDKTDGQIYECLKFDDYSVNLDYATTDLIDLFKRLFAENNDLANNLTEIQKVAIIQNKLEYHLNDVLDANVFRFAKISNKEDDVVYKLLKDGIDV